LAFCCTSFRLIAVSSVILLEIWNTICRAALDSELRFNVSYIALFKIRIKCDGTIDQCVKIFKSNYLFRCWHDSYKFVLLFLLIQNYCNSSTILVCGTCAFRQLDVLVRLPHPSLASLHPLKEYTTFHTVWYELETLSTYLQCWPTLNMYRANQICWSERSIVTVTISYLLSSQVVSSFIHGRSLGRTAFAWLTIGTRGGLLWTQ
jgi:hypothetical protein